MSGGHSISGEKIHCYVREGGKGENHLHAARWAS